MCLPADWFEAYAGSKFKPHMLYTTTNSDYGSRPPNVHTMQTMFFDRPQEFTNVRISLYRYKKLRRCPFLAERCNAIPLESSAYVMCGMSMSVSL